MMEVKGLEKVHYCSVLKEEKGGRKSEKRQQHNMCAAAAAAAAAAADRMLQTPPRPDPQTVSPFAASSLQSASPKPKVYLYLADPPVPNNQARTNCPKD